MDNLIDNLVLLRDQYGTEENAYFQAGDMPNYHLALGKRLAMETAINEARRQRSKGKQAALIIL